MVAGCDSRFTFKVRKAVPQSHESAGRAKNLTIWSGTCFQPVKLFDLFDANFWVVEFGLPKTVRPSVTTVATRLPSRSRSMFQFTRLPRLRYGYEQSPNYRTNPRTSNVAGNDSIPRWSVRKTEDCRPAERQQA